MRHLTRLRPVVTGAVLTLGLAGHPVWGVDSSSPSDRSSFAVATVVNPTTGEITNVPSSFTNTGAPDRSSFASATVVTPSTGELTTAPSSYTNTGATDRSSFAIATSVDPATGQFLTAPGSFVNTGAPDRSSFAAATTVTASTGELTGPPTSYTDTGALDRFGAASSTTVTPGGQITSVPSDWNPSTIVPALSEVMAFVLALAMMATGLWFLARRRRLALE